MPFVHIRAATPSPLPEADLRRLQQGATALMADILGKNRELTAVFVENPVAAAWTVGHAPAEVAAHLDARITKGTNTAEEKERFVAGAAALLREVLGAALPAATYVVLQEVPADAWGYDGRTQERRRRDPESRNPAAAA